MQQNSTTADAAMLHDVLSSTTTTTADAAMLHDVLSSTTTITTTTITTNNSTTGDAASMVLQGGVIAEFGLTVTFSRLGSVENL